LYYELSRYEKTAKERILKYAFVSGEIQPFSGGNPGSVYRRFPTTAKRRRRQKNKARQH
jgi:hypothetical protein